MKLINSLWKLSILWAWKAVTAVNYTRKIFLQALHLYYFVWYSCKFMLVKSFKTWLSGVTSIRGQTLTMGGYLRSTLDLPPLCRIGERISIRLTSVNRGSGSLKRIFEIAPVAGEGSFDFLSQDGSRMVRRLLKLKNWLSWLNNQPGNTKKGEVSLYHWPPVWLVWISLFCK